MRGVMSLEFPKLEQCSIHCPIYKCQWVNGKGQPWVLFRTVLADQNVEPKRLRFDS